MIMRVFLSLIIFLASIPTIAQTAGLASPTYSKSGKLIALTDIQGLSECPMKNVSGRVKKIDKEGSKVSFRIGPRGGPIVEMDTNRLADAEKRVVFRDMIRARYYVRVAAYVCKEDAPLSPFSIYRENDPDLK